MAVEFKVPELGENIESGDVVSVLVKEGDTIQANQGVVELETGKAVVEVPCPHAGKVAKIHVKAGDSVPVGATLLTVETDGAVEAAQPAPSKPAPAEKPAEKPPAKKEEPPAAKAAPAPQPAPSPPPAKEPSPPPAAPEAAAAQQVASPAGPATRRFARELGVDLSRINGTGPQGRITREDIAAAVRRANVQGPQPAAAKPPAGKTPPGVEDRDSWGTIRRDRLSKIRKTIAANMARSHSTIPHVTNFDDADVTELERIRKESTQDYEGTNIKLTMMAFIVKSVAHALRLHPLLNASLDLDNDQIIYKEYINIGLAVDTERGLVVPVLRQADRLTIPQIAQGLATLAAQARAAQFSPEDLRGGTFTISNLGAIGGTYSTPIINPPEVAVLLIGRSRKLPVVVDDELEIRLMMPLSLSYDHRVVDGAVAGRFLNEVIGFLQAPTRLLLAP
ncbi:MAG: 2-oxo acid dehydrogenase subunit E2 [Planctomycetes bacterium]|nr:2-oxo acid dehydrogenase subunit E2 [Planctomycetota bacterium]